MKLDPVIFREYDIRGVWNEQFDAAFAKTLGRAHVTFLKKYKNIDNPTLSIGHDARLSSPEIVSALSEGIRESGGNVLRLGLITSPISYFSTFTLNVDGAFMVTGSHNPPEFNGFKISAGKSTIFGQDIQKLKEIIDNHEFLNGQGKEETLDIFPSYLSRYKEEFKKIKNIPIVLDCGNGAAGCIVRQLFESVGLTPTILFEKPDGHFPNHHPDPTVEKNLQHLIQAVKENQAVVGIGFDGDADRIGIVDHTGRMIYGDELMCLCATAVLKTAENKTIIGDVKCSDRMFDFIERAGGKPLMWKTGHSLIKQKIKDEHAPFGGEMSGHIFFADRNYGYDDALYAALRVVEILAQTGKTIPELLEDLPPAFNTPELRIDTTEEKKHTIVQRLKDEFSQPSDEYSVNLIDGIRVSFPSGWALARASNTQPVLVLRFEADTKENLNKIQKRFEDIVNPML
ncbi:MAG: phosphomannomutase/phosphoglucomutase [Bdellovibrionales bacterium]|nr:phosphomannomutase/phosphoglucomutase [Bdellovibrionales bacterium]